jgi:hypothetical protein
MMKFAGFTLAIVIGFCGIPAPADGGFITTTFAGGNQFTGNMFDVTTSSSGLTITGLDVNIDSPGASVPISVYTRTGSYTASETSSAGWTLEGTVSVISAGSNTPTFVGIPNFTIAANAVTGFYVTINQNVNQEPFMQYTNGSNTYANTDLTVTTGIGEGGLFGSLGVFASRTWNGTLQYTVNPVPEPSSLVMCGLAGVVGLVVTRFRRKLVA